LLEQERWASPLRDEFRYALLDILTHRYGAIDVRAVAGGTAPWRIHVAITRFESQLGEAWLESTWSLGQRNAETPALRCQSSFRESAGGGTAALAQAQRRTVARLGDAIGDQMLACTGASPAAARPDVRSPAVSRVLPQARRDSHPLSRRPPMRRTAVVVVLLMRGDRAFADRAREHAMNRLTMWGTAAALCRRGGLQQASRCPGHGDRRARECTASASAECSGVGSFPSVGRRGRQPAALRQPAREHRPAVRILLQARVGTSAAAGGAQQRRVATGIRSEPAVKVRPLQRSRSASMPARCCEQRLALRRDRRCVHPAATWKRSRGRCQTERGAGLRPGSEACDDAAPAVPPRRCRASAKRRPCRRPCAGHRAPSCRAVNTAGRLPAASSMSA
jgi:hypothetical protein